MTVSTINGLSADVKRVQGNQNKPTSQTREETKTQVSASLPRDTISASATPTLDLNSAILATGAQNREAARATLSDEDFDQLERVEDSPQAKVQEQAKASVAAQTNKLPANILQVLAE